MPSHEMTQAIALRLHRIRFFTPRHKDIINICDYLQSAMNIIIFAPEEQEAFDAFTHILTRFKSSFPQAEITVVKNSIQQTVEPFPQSIKTLDFHHKDISVWGPSRRLLNALQNGKFQVAIDASRSFQIFNTIMVLATKAKLRICFDHPKREDLYNFIIRLEPNQSASNSYNILLKYLGAI
jgi:ADP-heptose:LPS heptosyltransferase